MKFWEKYYLFVEVMCIVFLDKIVFSGDLVYSDILLKGFLNDEYIKEC